MRAGQAGSNFSAAWGTVGSVTELEWRDGRMKTLNGIATLAFCGIIGVVLLNRKSEKNAGLAEPGASLPGSGMEKGGKGFLVLAIYGLIAIRVIGFGDIPGGVNQDGAMGAVDAKALAMYGTDRFGTFMPAHFWAWGYGQMSVLLSYLTVPFIKIWGLGKVTMRLPMLLASLLGAGGVYGITRKIFDEKTAMAALLFLAVNPWHFMQGRWALDCNLFPHMFIAGMYFLVKGLWKKRNLYISMVFFALCMYSYGVSFYMVPFFLLACCILLYLRRKVGVKEILICLAAYFAVAWPIYGTMLINFMKWESVELPFVTMQFFNENVRSADILFFSGNIGQQLLINIRSLVNVVFLQKEDLPWNSIKEFGTMYLCSMPLILLGAAVVFRKGFWGKEKDGGGENKQLACRILAFYWIFALLTGIMINAVNVNRINIIFYSHIIFGAVGIGFLVKRWKGSLWAVCAGLGILSILFFHTYFTRWAEEMEDVFYGDFVDALAYAGEFNGDCYLITPDTQYQGAYNVTEILTLFVLDVDARYYQGETDRWKNKEIAYRNRLLYGNPPEGTVPPGNVIYVIKSSDQDKFSRDEFQVSLFGNYGTAVPWAIAAGQ